PGVPLRSTPGYGRSPLRGCESERYANLNGVDKFGDSPPDLVIEVEHPNQTLKRLPLCARAAIPEVWYHDLGSLRILELRSDRTYSDVNYSPAFPLVSTEDLDRFLSLLRSQDLTTISREFRAWVETIKPTIVSSRRLSCRTS